MELALKHHLELSGIDYPRTHDIDSLLTLCEAGLFSEIEPWAGTITAMESKTRYIKNYRLSLRKVEQIMTIAADLIKQIELLHQTDAMQSQ